MAKDYYDTLGVERTATRDEVKKAYKRLAKKYHPDLNKDNPQAEEHFKKINEAASVLADEKKRAQYDRFGSADMSGFESGAAGFDFSQFGFNFDDIFENLFGRDFGFGGAEGRRRTASARRGQDLGTDLEVTLEEVSSGAEKALHMARDELCGSCRGTGAHSESDLVECPACRGSGIVQHTRRTPFGLFSTSTTCGTCRGEGKTVRKPCAACHGRKTMRVEKTLKVSVPAGIYEGAQLRISGEGQPGSRPGLNGDLYIRIAVKQHPVFIRDGADITCDVPLSFVQAVLGDEIEVPTLGGKAKLTIPPGTEGHTLFRMQDKGLPHLRSHGRGFQYVRMVIEVPKHLSKEQKEKLREFERLSGKEKPYQKLLSKLGISL